MKLIFVYNANSGLLNTLRDIGHKTISPQTYQCNLCDLTHGLLKERKQWREFKETATVEMEFLHKDECQLPDAPLRESAGLRNPVLN